MRTALLLIDLQHDFLRSSQLQPPCAALISAAATLLSVFRRAGAPVVHVWTTIDRADQAMPHWQQREQLICVQGSEGHATPVALQPVPGEWIQHKRCFSGFADGELAQHLRNLEVEQLVLAGVHLRACVRHTAIDAYQQGWRVWIAAEATGDDDPLHAGISREWMARRGMALISTSAVRRLVEDRLAEEAPPSAGAHGCPAHPERLLWSVAPPPPREIDRTVTASRRAQPDWNATDPRQRDALFARLEQELSADQQSLALEIAEQTGKPLRFAAAEVIFAIELVQAARHSALSSAASMTGDGWQARRRALGVVAAITPWNNPLAIPLGKLAPALLHGNAVVWKPAIPGLGVARRCLELLRRCGLPEAVVTLLEGDAQTASFLMDHAGIDGITITGGPAAGLSAQMATCRRPRPLQAELGGNNAAIVWSDADLEAAARAVAAGAFDAAGQRCTANRRVIVPAQIVDHFRECLMQAIADLRWGDPLDPATRIGPVISPQAAQRLESLILRAEQAGDRVHRWGTTPPLPTATHEHCWVAPALVESQNPDGEMVQEESFGPILVLQTAHDWDEALRLCNGVRQGLAAALFSQGQGRLQDFQQRAQAGILKLNTSTAGAEAMAPFNGWKSSGIGPPEHGFGDIEYFTRWQTVYDSQQTMKHLASSDHKPPPELTEPR
jgi:acyl-CoA reductase-like NAD-dependent aldehyde dehydrogenase/nicotinamidase-related amidase